MIEIVSTIIPIFSVIILGNLLSRVGFLSRAFIGPANNLTFYVAIPALVFRAIARTSFHAAFNSAALASVYIPMAVLVLLLMGMVRWLRIPRHQAGTLIQCSFHGNLSQVGLAVVYYYLGEKGFAQASILTGFLILLQNFVSVAVLTHYAGNEEPSRPRGFPLRDMLLHPIILATIPGIILSFLEVPLPAVAERFLAILAGLALPLALLVIGASLSFSLVRSGMKLVLASGFFKLILLPALSIPLALLFGLSADEFHVVLILMAAPTATVSYIMAVKMDGDPDLAGAALSINTLAAALTYMLWLSVLA